MKRNLLLLYLIFAIGQCWSQETNYGYITVAEGGSIYYESEGTGTPVVLLHGHTLDLRMWDQQVQPLLDAGYRVIRPEMRGYGHSSKQADGLQFTHLDDIMTVLDSLHLERVHVVGLSMGSFVASEMVAMYPERLISATLASGSIRDRKGPSTPIDSTEWAKEEERVNRVKEMGLEQWKRDWIEELITGGGSNSESIRESLTAQVNDWDGWLQLHHSMRLYYGEEAWESLKNKRPTLPVLILSGENEKKGRNKMLNYLPNGRQVKIEDAGHMTNMEKPEEFNALMLEEISLGEKALNMQ